MNPKQTKIDWSKPVESLDGKPLRVLCTDRPVGSSWMKPVLAITKYGVVCSYDLDTDHVRNVKQKHTLTGWINIYPDGYIVGIKGNKIEANACCAGASRVACIPITIEYYEGQGLEDED